MALCWWGGLGCHLFLEQLKTEFQLFFVKPVVSYSQIPAKGSEILKTWKKGKHVERHSASQAPGHLAVSWTWIMVFCVTRNIWLSQLKDFLRRRIRNGNIKPQAASFGEGQRQYLTWQELKQPQMFLPDLETENYSIGKKCDCSGPYATIHEDILSVSYWQKETTTAPPHPPNTLLWVSTSLLSVECGEKRLQGIQWLSV